MPGLSPAHKVVFGALLCLFLLVTASAFADSQARIVRLSDVQGDVRVDRNTGQGFEKAFMNLPLTQGAKIQTRMDARAVVEFEDGATLRIVPASRVLMEQLSLRDSGTKVSTVAVQDGTVYLNLESVNGNEFTVTAGHEKLILSEPARVRVTLGGRDLKVAVLRGKARVSAPSGDVEVAKNQTATFDLANQDRYELAKDVEPGAYDQWDKQASQYQQRYSKTAYNSYSPYTYGVSDLNYYGSFFNAPGYGMLWQPYLVGAGWDPFMDGMWAFYPGFGYNWVSAYPWGWTPYHSGSWVFVAPYGWVWQPGGPWNGFNGIPPVVNAPANFQRPVPPASGQGMVAVNRGPGFNGAGAHGNRVEVRNNSAGLGVPRGGVANLRDLSQSVEKHGAATTRVATAPIGVPAWRTQPGYGSSPIGAGRSSVPQAGPAPGAHASLGAHGGGRSPK